jgi:CRP/FNR family transcriptional regulator
MINECLNPERHCIACEYKSPLFCFLTEQELELIEKTKISVRFNPGETIRKQGTFMSHVLSINEGMAKLYLEGTEHRNAIIRIVKPTNFIGGPGIFLDQRHHYTVAALTDTTVCFIDLGVFKELLDRNRPFAHAVLQDFSKNILSVYNRLLFLTQKQMPGRIADTLIYLADEVFESTTFPMYLSKQDISELSGMSKESATKTLRKFQQENIIRLSEDKLEILDPDKVRLISKTG